jgi:hypothetical protein
MNIIILKKARYGYMAFTKDKNGNTKSFGFAPYHLGRFARGVAVNRALASL